MWNLFYDRKWQEENVVREAAATDFVDKCTDEWTTSNCLSVVQNDLPLCASQNGNLTNGPAKTSLSADAGSARVQT